MSKEIEYKKETLDLVRQLTSISKSVVFTKTDDGKIAVDTVDASETVAYEFRAPVSDFDFEGDECAFFDYPEFHSILNSFNNALIQQDESNIYFKEGRRTTKYNSSESEVINNTFGGIDFEDPEAIFKLTDANVKQINKLIGLLGGPDVADTVVFTIEETEVKITIKSSENHLNTNEEYYDLTEPSTERFELSTSSSIFSILPSGNYNISIKEEGAVRFALINDEDVTLNIYTGKNEED